MSQSDKFLDVYRKHRDLFEKAKVQTLSRAEYEALASAVEELESLTKLLKFRLKSIDPEIYDAIKAAEIYNDHYRRKVELDQKLFGEST